MKPVWLIETGVWKDDNVTRMIGILRDLQHVVHAEPYTPLGGTEFEIVGEERPVIYYGSLNTSQYLRLLHKNWVPLIWFDTEAFGCRSYYAHWGKHLIQQDYALYPVGELPRLKDRLYRTFGKEGSLFIRPDENDKSFSGRLVPEDNFSKWFDEIRVEGVVPEALAVVASPVRLDAEWRFVIADRKVVAGSGYKGGGKLENVADCERQARAFAQAIAAEPWQPHVIYCLDVAYRGDGRLGILEIGNINSAGLYRCDLLPVIQAMNAIAERDFQNWKGKL
jgi:hypothetical protein